jgi:alkylation response protein AidB-like acyl-CoA dehydrogenase
VVADRTILTEDESVHMIRDAARCLLEAEGPSDLAMDLDARPEILRKIWLRSADDGWTTLAPNGGELGLSATLTIMQELGRASCPIPLADTVLANAVLNESRDPNGTLFQKGIHGGAICPVWVWGHLIGRTGGFGLAFEFTSAPRLSGRVAFVENASMATHLFLITGRPSEIAIVSMGTAGVSVNLTPGLNIPSLAEVTFDNVEVRLLTGECDLSTLAPLARLMASARALGAVQRGLEILTDYAMIRSQFGHKIGQYQAIQHKLANCLIGVEVCRLSIVRAGASTGSRSSLIYAAAIAAANAGQVLRQVILELHHGFGGISFWNEHEMPLHFHRVHGDLTKLGGVQAAREDLARALLDAPAGSSMPDLDLGEVANAFRAEVRAWLIENWDHQYDPETESQPLNHRKAMPGFSRKVGAKGWIGVSWPREYGGQARSALEQLVFEEEMTYSEAPTMYHSTASNMIGPTIIRFGSQTQKDYFLPRIARGEISFALGYSEPDHGSDLAGIRTSAKRGPTGWIINGQKTYTSSAGFSTHIWLIARTDPSRPRHSGISVFMVALDTPGITARRMMGLNGHCANDVFFDDVQVPADALIGEENDGWKLITTALAYERVALASIGARARSYFDRLLDHFRRAVQDGRRLSANALVRDRVGAIAAEVEGARLMGAQTALVMQAGDVPVVQAAMVKVYASELMERLSETAFDLLGAGATLKAGPSSALIDGKLEFAVRDALLYTIGGGTNEIQRTLIALRGLGLPR